MLRIVFLVTSAALAGTAPPASGQAARSGGGTATQVTFDVRVENVAKRALTLAGGRLVDIPNSSGVWAIHTGPNPIIVPGQTDSGLGLKGLAEAGMASAFAPHIRGLPGVRAAGAFETALGRPLRGMSTKSAEGGGANASRMLQLGQRFEFSVTAAPGDRLSLAMMISQSNDGLIGTGPDGIALFDAAGRPITGDVSAHLSLWDAGTEVNEEPGMGPNQGLRQRASHAGDPERRPLRPMSEAEFGERWPAAARIVRVTVSQRR